MKRAKTAVSVAVGYREKSQIMSASEIDRTLVRLAHEIVERNNGTEGLVLVGVQRRGLPIAARLAEGIAGIEKVKPPVGSVDITPHRDDSKKQPLAANATLSPIPVSIQDMTIILVDDVLFTGRSTRAALDALIDHGRPRRVELCVLIDRGHRELPIQANYVGRVVPTTVQEIVEVHLSEVDGEDRVILCERG
ncbi:MAG: bifunctional pyr operon transcriptional regulator/uracil phosphoribosyltransferase PyrR [Acidobacteria bacterium]|nr:bifunctional pyr operon transcriptional regulator/uracil phosphoribosyltransferase PyrR [Acidobacteriota bacterium]